MNSIAAPAVLSERHITAGTVPRFELDEWRAFGITAGITGRSGDFDLGLFTQGAAGAILGRWLTLERTLRPGFTALAVARQEHGREVQTHAEAGPGWRVSDAVDGHVTATPGLLLTVTVADCIPVYLAHPDSGTMALLHAGWRGIAGGILEAGIGKLTELAKCSTSEVLMHCGVGICGACYQVGPEVIHKVTGRSVSGPESFDLRAALAERAGQAGLTRVTMSAWCTAHDEHLFFSHRRSQGRDGRMVAYLGLPVSQG